MLDRFPVTYTRRGLSGSVVGHDTTHTYTYSSLFHFICIYCPRSKYVLQTLHTKRARPRHGRQSIARAFIRRRDATRPRLETIERRRDGRTNRTNERTRSSSSSSSPTRRDRESYTRASNRCRENPFIGRASDGKVNARGFIHSFIHSFGSVTRWATARPATSLDRVDVDGLVRDAAVDA